MFQSASQQHLVWRARWDCDSDVGRLCKVLMHRPGDEMNIIDPAKRLDHLSSCGDAEGETWYWRGDEIVPLGRATGSTRRFERHSNRRGVELLPLAHCAPGRRKSIYIHDSFIAVKGGAVITRLGQKVRRSEEGPVTETLAEMKIHASRYILTVTAAR